MFFLLLSGHIVLLYSYFWLFVRLTPKKFKVYYLSFISDIFRLI